MCLAPSGASNHHTTRTCGVDTESSGGYSERNQERRGNRIQVYSWWEIRCVAALAQHEVKGSAAQLLKLPSMERRARAYRIITLSWAKEPIPSRLGSYLAPVVFRRQALSGLLKTPAFSFLPLGGLDWWLGLAVQIPNNQSTPPTQGSLKHSPSKTTTQGRPVFLRQSFAHRDWHSGPCLTTPKAEGRIS